MDLWAVGDDGITDDAPEVAEVCLFFRGEAGRSWGAYLPGGYSIRPQGADVAEHQVMHLHEIHHKVLNDDTAWGALIHIAARHPGWSPQPLASLLKACRTVHESFASFMSLSLATTRHANAANILAGYPVYQLLARRMDRVLEPVEGLHRRDLAATGIARWCMSAPVLELALAAYPEPLQMSDIPAVLRPDHRFRLVSRVSPQAVAGAALSADHAFLESHGRPVSDLALEETDAALDEAWGSWEDAFISTLVDGDGRLASVPRVAPHAHLVAADQFKRAAASHGLELDLPHAIGAGPITDLESVQRILAAQRFPLRKQPFRAALAVPGRDVDLDAVLALCAAGTPHLVVHARRTESLHRSFRFGPSDEDRLVALEPGPLFAIRSLVDHEGDDLLLHTEILEPNDLASLEQVWNAGVRAVCITASCYLESEWQYRWGQALRSWPTVVVADMGLAGMAGEGRLLGSAEMIRGCYLGLGRPDVTALVWHVEDRPHLMLALGDDLTIQLIAGQLEDLAEGRLDMHGDFTVWLDVLKAVSGQFLGTEADLHYNGAHP